MAQSSDGNVYDLSPLIKESGNYFGVAEVEEGVTRKLGQCSSEP